MCNAFGGIFRVWLARSCDAQGAFDAISGALDLSAFAMAEPLPGALYSEELALDDDGESFAASISFALAGDSQGLADFERPYIGPLVDALVEANSGQRLLFRGLSMSRRRESGAQASEPSIRAYQLSRLGTEQAVFIQTLL
jgi:hypothetical protein